MATETTAPVQTTAAAPAAATTAQAPAVDESLSQALAARAEQMSSGGPAKAEEAVSAEEPAAAAEGGEVLAETTEAAPEAAPPAEPAKVDPPKDAVADELAKIARASQSAAHRQRDLDTREKAITAKAEVIHRAESLEELAKSDPLKAIEMLLGPGALEGNLPFQLIDAAVERQKGKPAPTPEEQQADLVRQAKDQAIKEIEEKRAAENKRAADAQQAEREVKKAHYFNQLAEFTRTNASKFELVASEGIDVPEVEQFIDLHYAATGKLATAEEILGHFEGQLEAKAKRYQAILSKRGQPPAAAPAAKATTPSAAAKPAVDTRGKASTTKKVSSYEEDRDARMAALNQR